jgi:hypothetical protein
MKGQAVIRRTGQDPHYHQGGFIKDRQMFVTDGRLCRCCGTAITDAYFCCAKSDPGMPSWILRRNVHIVRESHGSNQRTGWACRPQCCVRQTGLMMRTADK